MGPKLERRSRKKVREPGRDMCHICKPQFLAQEKRVKKKGTISSTSTVQLFYKHLSSLKVGKAGELNLHLGGRTLFVVGSLFPPFICGLRKSKSEVDKMGGVL